MTQEQMRWMMFIVCVSVIVGCVGAAILQGVGLL